MGRLRAGAALVGGAIAASIGACSGARPDATVGQGLAATRVEAPAELPATCFRFLAQLECWMEGNGNDSADVQRALGVARGVFEARAPSDAGDGDAGAYCGRAIAYRRPLFQVSGCDNHVASRSLPPAQASPCAADEHFFMRRDGHVSGCHPDCAADADCAHGTTCKSIGTAAGGPIDEPFCE